jgi:membrane protease YdiL (CAAX protease family)
LKKGEKSMNSITSFIKRHPQGVFWGIACITFFLAAFLQEIGLWGLLIYGTFLAGALVTGIADGRSGLKTYFSRIVRWRVGFKWYAVALLTPPVLYLAAAGLNVLSGATIATNIQWPAWTDILIAFLWPGFFAIALAEEPGFRGFALPRFLVGRSALRAALILGVLHAIWHLPFFLGMLFEGNPIGILSLALIVISGAILNTWLFNHTNGSVLIAMLMHASIDVVSGDFGLLKLLFSGANLESQAIWQAVVYAAIAILLPILAGKELGRKPEAAMATMVAEPLAAAD